MSDDQRDPFSEACGLDGPLEVRVEGRGWHNRSPVEFHRPHLILGRDPRADLTLDDPAISRRHAYFQVIAGRILCLDLGSRRGVSWANGNKLVGWVEPGQDIKIGSVGVRLGCGAGGRERQGEGRPLLNPLDRVPLPELSLSIIAGGPGCVARSIGWGLILIGRSPSFRANPLSRKIACMHAALVRTPAGIWVVDLLGPGGVLVGETPTPAIRLKDGDVIGLGDYRIRVRIRPTAPSIRRQGGDDRSSCREIQLASEGVHLPEDLDAGEERRAEVRREVASATAAIAASMVGEFDRMHQRTTQQFEQTILMMFQMHQDQMDVIRDELSRINRIEEEQRFLRTELEQIVHLRTPPAVLKMVSGGPASASASTPDLDPTRPPKMAGPCEGGPPFEHQQVDAGPSPPPDLDPHDRLTLRLAELQEERQGLWSRLLGTLTGGESERILP